LSYKSESQTDRKKHQKRGRMRGGSDRPFSQEGVTPQEKNETASKKDKTRVEGGKPKRAGIHRGVGRGRGPVGGNLKKRGPRDWTVVFFLNSKP